MLPHQAKVPRRSSPPFPLTPSHGCLFSLSFHPYTPSLFPSHFPSLPLFSPSQGHTLHRLVGLVSLAHLEHTNTHSDANIHSDALKRGSFTQCLRVVQEKTENDKQTEEGWGERKRKEADKGRELTGEMCIPLACLARECRRRVAGCSVYYPQAIWVGKLLGRGEIHLCVSVSVCVYVCVCVLG